MKFKLEKLRALKRYLRVTSLMEKCLIFIYNLLEESAHYVLQVVIDGLTGT